MITLDEVRAAAVRIAPYVHRTPLATSRTLDRELDAEFYFKCENLQKVGAFKARGAVNAVLSLAESEAARGVVSHSSGNHAAALAYAAGIRGIPCTIVMPDDAPAIKVAAVRGYGATIVFCPRAEREQTCRRLLDERGATLIHPFTHKQIIAGQATAALELIEQQEGLDAIIAPVGGGGLLSGTAISARGLLPDVSVLGAEPDAVDDAYRSLASGELQPGVEQPETLADGLMTGLGQINFEILRELQVEVVTVSEQAIVEAATFIVQRMKLVVEPSAATVLAAIRRCGDRFRGKRVGAILSGGNTDFSWLR